MSSIIRSNNRSISWARGRSSVGLVINALLSFSFVANGMVNFLVDWMHKHSDHCAVSLMETIRL
jgi:hypothetical protein